MTNRLGVKFSQWSYAWWCGLLAAGCSLFCLSCDSAWSPFLTDRCVDGGSCASDMSAGGAADMLCADTSPPTLTGYIDRIYLAALGRQPNATELNNCLSYYATNGCNVGTLTNRAVSVYTSSEYTSKGYNIHDEVITLYPGLLGRCADSGGVNFWEGKFDMGTSLGSIIPQFTGDNEFTFQITKFCH